MNHNQPLDRHNYTTISDDESPNQVYHPPRATCLCCFEDMCIILTLFGVVIGVFYFLHYLGTTADISKSVRTSDSYYAREVVIRLQDYLSQKNFDGLVELYDLNATWVSPAIGTSQPSNSEKMNALKTLMAIRNLYSTWMTVTYSTFTSPISRFFCYECYLVAVASYSIVSGSINGTNFCSFRIPTHTYYLIRPNGMVSLQWEYFNYHECIEHSLLCNAISSGGSEAIFQAFAVSNLSMIALSRNTAALLLDDVRMLWLQLLNTGSSEEVSEIRVSEELQLYVRLFGVAVRGLGSRVNLFSTLYPAVVDTGVEVDGDEHGYSGMNTKLSVVTSLVYEGISTSVVSDDVTLLHCKEIVEFAVAYVMDSTRRIIGMMPVGDSQKIQLATSRCNEYGDADAVSFISSRISLASAALVDSFYLCTL